MPTPSELVTESFAQANSYANDAQTKLTTFLAGLTSAIQTTPLIDISFTPVADPGVATPATYVPAGDYSSSLMSLLTTTILNRLAGGTGLPTAVEAALWDRAREREVLAAAANIDQISSDMEGLGWDLPPGVLFDAVARETRGYYDKVSTISRDIAMKQADLEQANWKTSIDQGLQLETALAEVTFKRSSVVLDAYRAEIMRFDAEVRQDVAHWETNIKQYEAQQNYILNGQKINSDLIRANTTSLLEAGKVGAQVYAQLTASAWGIIHTSASVSAGASMSVGYSYSNETLTAPPAVESV